MALLWAEAPGRWAGTPTPRHPGPKDNPSRSCCADGQSPSWQSGSSQHPEIQTWAAKLVRHKPEGSPGSLGFSAKMDSEGGQHIPTHVCMHKAHLWGDHIFTQHLAPDTALLQAQVCPPGPCGLPLCWGPSPPRSELQGTNYPHEGTASRGEKQYRIWVL